MSSQTSAEKEKKGKYSHPSFCSTCLTERHNRNWYRKVLN